ncbi:MAG TPA: LysR family transcriptional regulator [Polyangiaceae bacterium]
MAGALSTLDWSLVRTFLAVAELGSLSAAARALGTSQPTAGRQIRALEAELGVELFRRRDRGLSLTEIGETLLPSARAIERAVRDLELAATGKEESLDGTVRVTSSVVTATHHLPPIIARLRSAEPLISIELDPNDDSSNLHFREADIAVRMYRPKQLDLVTRLLGELRLGVFAAKSYAKRRGLPKKPEDLLAHDIVGMDRGTALLEGFRAAGYPVDREWFKVRCDPPAAHWELVRAGCGIGFGQLSVGLVDPMLVEVPLALDLPSLPVYLTAHEAVRRKPRVEKVWNHLERGLAALIAREARTRRRR